MWPTEMKSRLALPVFVLALFLAACGGGGSGAVPTIVPGTKLNVVTTTVQVARLYDPALLIEIAGVAEIPQARFCRPASKPHND